MIWVLTLNSRLDTLERGSFGPQRKKPEGMDIILPTANYSEELQKRPVGEEQGEARLLPETFDRVGVL
jgi:hypothetical protein